jgi:hypothetical protein
MTNNKHIWEGWTVQHFIDDLEFLFDRLVSNSNEFGTNKFQTREDVKKWCMDNQPYYKKYIPEVVDYFYNKIK